MRRVSIWVSYQRRRRQLAVSAETPQQRRLLLLASWEPADGLNSFAATFRQPASAAYKPGSPLS